MTELNLTPPDQWDEEPEIAREPQLEPPTPAKRWPIFVGALLVVAAAIAAYVVFTNRTPESAATEATPKTVEPIRPLGGASTVVLPPLDESDEAAEKKKQRGLF